MANPKFIQGKGEFHNEIKRRVTQYFIERQKPMTGNTGLLVKGILLFLGYLSIYIHLVFFTPIVWIAIPECIVFGGITAAIGFNVMHDGAHGSFSAVRFSTRWLGFP